MRSRCKLRSNMNQVSIGKRKQCFGCTRKNCTFYFRNDSVFAYANYNGTNWREMKYMYIHCINTENANCIKSFAFTIHETPTKNLLRFVKYYSQFSSENFICSFFPCYIFPVWLWNGLVWFLHCFCVWQFAARKTENAHHFKCVLNAILSNK